jgi:26S proteasome regulatory subunit N2
LRKLRNILVGELSIKLSLDFLLRNNNTDIGVLTKIKSLFEPRISVLHTATIVANSIMHCGTTKDTFLRENLEWLVKATAWSKFTTTAGLGVIHKGHISEAMTVLEPYLPKLGVDASAYTEGGSLCALGLIYANHANKKVVDYLLEQLRNLNIAFMNNIANDQNPQPGSLDPEKKKEIVQHGAALGLGLAALGTGNEEVFEELQLLCFTPKAATAGEACGIGMGLVMLGTATKKGADMLQFARQIQHEKVIRSIGLGLGFTMYGLQERADTMIESLFNDKDPVLRYGGQFTVGLAYCGTANNGAIRKLLHVAVSDVNNDVRRAAVISLGFVMFRQAEQVPRLVSLLAESYNPHVRYGAALALGIACAGTGMKEAIALLEPLTTDATPFVRQGAFIALAMVLIQTSEQAEPKVKTIRQLFLDTIADKHQAQMSKFGAILALGIIDAGGRNQTIALSSRSGHLNLSAIVGLTIFVQYWYWYPFLNYLSLALSPTAVIGINKNLEMPNYVIKSNAKPSLFAYPAEMKAPKEKAVKALPTFQLSITKKTKRREDKKTAEKGGDVKDDDKMDVEKVEPEVDGEKKEAADKEKEIKEPAKPEPTFELLNNPARVTPTQLQFISYDVDPRYVPIVQDSGIVLLKDLKPQEKEELLEINRTSALTAGTDNEPEAPEPFEFLG